MTAQLPEPLRSLLRLFGDAQHTLGRQWLTENEAAEAAACEQVSIIGNLLEDELWKLLHLQVHETIHKELAYKKLASLTTELEQLAGTITQAAKNRKEERIAIGVAVVVFASAVLPLPMVAVLAVVEAVILLRLYWRPGAIRNMDNGPR